MDGCIDISRLSLDELVGVVNIYPWFSRARKELCLRVSRFGGQQGGEGLFADAALYLPSRRKLSDIVRSSTPPNLTDAELDMIIKSYIVEETDKESNDSQPQRRVYAGAGDYFSQEDYDQVRKTEDNVFSRYARTAKEDSRSDEKGEAKFDLFTETLAQIYAEQGYYEQAKDIYSKLILAYPEKNAYFAALIRKIEELN